MVKRQGKETSETKVNPLGNHSEEITVFEIGTLELRQIFQFHILA